MFTTTRTEVASTTAVPDMTNGCKISVGLFAIIFVSACGRAGTTPSGVAPALGSFATAPLCSVQTTTGLLTASEIAPQLAVQNPPPSTSDSLGLFGNGDSAYPGYVGNASASFYWTGLASSEAQALTGEAWSGLKYSGTPPPGDFLPSSGGLYSAYPQQVFLVAEQVDNFGSVANATQWMTFQRQDNPANSNPKYGNGVESDPTVASLGDDTFVYQLDRGAPTASLNYTGAFVGDVYTDLEVRTGDLIYSISVDSSAGVDAVSTAISLVQQLMSKEASSCSSDARPTSVTPSAVPTDSSPTTSVGALPPTPSASATVAPGGPVTATPVPLPSATPAR